MYKQNRLASSRLILPLLAVGFFTLFVNELSAHKINQGNDKRIVATVGLEILASSSFLPVGGNTVQLRAILNHVDGTSEDVTSEVVWAISNPEVGDVTADGSFKSSGREGSTIVLAAFESVMGASTTIIVVGTNSQAQYAANLNQ